MPLRRCPTLVQGVEADINICLQHALEVSQVPLRMDALATWRVSEPYRRRAQVAGLTVVAHIGSDAPGFGFSIASRKHRHRRVMSANLATSTWASKPGPTMPRLIGRLGAGACTIAVQQPQASVGRTWRMTRKLAGTNSSCSDTSSPSCFRFCRRLGNPSSLAATLFHRVADAQAAACAAPASAGRDLLAAIPVRPRHRLPANLRAAIQAVRSDGRAFRT
jgi:hypothetical protein